MTNHFGKILPNVAHLTKSLRNPLHGHNMWILGEWGSTEQNAFNQLKELLSSLPAGAQYSATIAAEASSSGLGAMLTQKQPEGDQRPVAFLSRNFTKSEHQYAQVEKEALVVIWVCEWLHTYFFGLEFNMETDHRPLDVFLD